MPPHAVDLPHISTASLSDVGPVRTRNEDTCGEFTNGSGHRLLVTADGMGGHTGGAEASQTAVQAIAETFAESLAHPAETLQVGITRANDRIQALVASDPSRRGMGTTAVALLFGPRGQGWVAHVGDSRAYRLRDGHLEPMTRDHSVVAELERRGLISPEEAETHPRRNEILRSVGVAAAVEVDVASFEVAPGDVYLLCSDGLTGPVSEARIAEILLSYPPEEAARLLIDTAIGQGGSDNITVQIARVAPLDDTVPIPARGDATVPIRAPGTTGTFAPIETSEVLSVRKRRRLAVAGAVLLGGLAALTLLWRIYSMTHEPVPPSQAAALERGAHPTTSTSTSTPTPTPTPTR